VFNGIRLHLEAEASAHFQHHRVFLKNIPRDSFESFVETLEDALAEGMSTGHPQMPEFRLDPHQVGDFISFLKSLE
jgi:hypothetical protein